jgi:two-component system LytT family sensor kinase
MSTARKVLLLAGLWSLLGALFATQAFIGSHYSTIPLSWAESFGVAFIAWYVRGLLALPAFWLATRVQFARGRVLRALVVHVPASVVYAFAGQMIFTALVRGIAMTARVMPSPAEAQISLVVYWIVVGAAHAVRYYTRVHETEIISARLQSQLANARLDVLRGQLHPHFLFNTLNDIAELIHEDPDRADEMLTTVSELLRTSLARTDQRDISLEHELDFLERYLEIARMRFRDRLTIDVDVPLALRATMVPSLILQPVVENAIRHGVARRDGGGRVSISARTSGNRLRLEVRDNGPGPATDARNEGMGLRTTR